MSMKIDVLREEYLEDVVKLVSTRYKALREKLSILPATYENVDLLAGLLRDLSDKPDGIVALNGGRLVGFLAGLVIPEFFGKRAMYSPDWANGAELGNNRRVYEEMYTHLSRQWVDEGYLIHAVSILSNDLCANEAWKWLGFGLSNIDGARDLKTIESNGEMTKVRQAKLEDLSEVAALGLALEKHMANAPTFWIHECDDYEAWMNVKGNQALLAYQGSDIVGFMAMEPGKNCECMFLQDEKTVNVSAAYTVEGSRGKGVASTILNRALLWAQEEGYERCAVDFEAMNVLASHFWMRWFKPVSYSWIRWIDERLRS